MNNIAFERPEYKKQLSIWAKMRDVCAGADAVKNKGNEYLPYITPSDKSKENRQRNLSYITRAVFYAIANQTKIGLIGLAFSKDASFTISNKLDYLKTNSDGAGISIYQQSQSVLESTLEVARHGLYVDYTSESDQAIILSYRAEDIINWRTTRINGRDVLVLVVLKETIEVPNDYGYEDKIQYRELVLEDNVFTCRVWRKVSESGEYTIDSEYSPKPKGKDHWNEIPFIFIGAQNNDTVIDDSPLAPLVEINLGHYRNSADYEDSLFFCGQIQPYITGLDTEWRDYLEKSGIKVGSRTPILLPSNGSFGYAQAQPNMLAKEGMDSKREYMIALGARLIEQNSAVKTATQASSEQSASTSVLSICCANVSEAYTQAINWCAHYLGLSEDNNYALNQEFISNVADAGMITAIVNSWQSGAIRDKDMVRALQKTDIIDPSDNPDEIVQQIKDQPPQFTR